MDFTLVDEKIRWHQCNSNSFSNCYFEGFSACHFDEVCLFLDEIAKLIGYPRADETWLELCGSQVGIGKLYFEIKEARGRPYGLKHEVLDILSRIVMGEEPRRELMPILC